MPLELLHVINSLPSKGYIQMTPSEAAALLSARLAEYASDRRKDVARGAETPALAGVLVQKFGYGLADAFRLVFPDDRGSFGYPEVDAAVATVDPEWRSHQDTRWSARPAGLSLQSAGGATE
ncbi:hypothetical protein [Cupriavidus sp. TMH.W2]|uniref:hypothetical protein n=1 Tax=Cupriavidus sp. TMH.W2 TaxID=3434465 RepID=UPI003D76D048